MKSLKLAAKDGGEFITDDAANVYSGKYPLARFLYIYVNKAPDKPLCPLVQEFLALRAVEGWPGDRHQGRLSAASRTARRRRAAEAEVN